MGSAQQKALDDFDPNDEKRLPWATYVLGRSPGFKAHTTRALALNAVLHGWYALLYRWQVDKWVLIARKCREDHNGRCETCLNSTLEQAAIGFLQGSTVDTGEFLWRKVNRKIPDPPELLYVCKRCYQYLR